MAQVHPFQPYRYTPKAGPIQNLVTQPYDKISDAMRARYLELSPFNLVRIILGERFPSDNEQHNVYTRASDYLDEWIRDGILAQDAEPAFYAYFQSFDGVVRKSFIGLGPVEDYSAGIVYPHERTLAGPKKDRMELLKHTHAHFGQIFMLYPDAELTVDHVLDDAAADQAEPLADVTDEYGARHRVWPIADPVGLQRIQQGMSGKKLLIADGHHRYETALAFHKEHPEMVSASRVMMTFVNMHSPGLKILATHRVVRGWNGRELPARPLGSLDDLKALFANPEPGRIRIGIAQGPVVHLFERDRKPGELDVRVLHEELLGMSEEDVRDEKHLEYVRGLDAAFGKVVSGQAQVAFLLEPTTIDQVADVAFGGGVMPQKSTDFFPKLLSGLTIYRL